MRPSLGILSAALLASALSGCGDKNDGPPPSPEQVAAQQGPMREKLMKDAMSKHVAGRSSMDRTRLKMMNPSRR